MLISVFAMVQENYSAGTVFYLYVTAKIPLWKQPLAKYPCVAYFLRFQLVGEKVNFKWNSMGSDLQAVYPGYFKNLAVEI